MIRRPPTSTLFPYPTFFRSHTSELQSHSHLVCRLLDFRRVLDRKSTRLNSSHTLISYAVFCLKKKKMRTIDNHTAAPPTRRIWFVSVPCRCSTVANPTAAAAIRRIWFVSVPSCLFFFNDTATTEIYTLSLHDALPISRKIRFFALANRAALFFSAAM